PCSNLPEAQVCPASVTRGRGGTRTRGGARQRLPSATPIMAPERRSGEGRGVEKKAAGRGRGLIARSLPQAVSIARSSSNSIWKEGRDATRSAKPRSLG